MAKKNDYRECPFCAEVIKAKASKCKHCKSFLDVPPAGRGPFKKMTVCLECGKEIRAGAIKCRHCKSYLRPEHPKGPVLEKEAVIEPDELHKEEAFQEKTAAIKPEHPQEQKELPKPDKIFEPVERLEEKTCPRKDKAFFENSKRKVALMFAGLSSRINIARINERISSLVLSVTGLFSRIDKNKFIDIKKRFVSAMTGILSRISISPIIDGLSKLTSTAAGIFSRINKNMLISFKQKLVATVTGFPARTKKAFTKISNSRVANISVNLILVILVVFVASQFIGQYREQDNDDQATADEPLAFYSEEDLEELAAASEIEIIFVKRVREFENIVPSNPEKEVVLVLQFTGAPEAEIRSTQLLFNEEVRSFSSGYRVAGSDGIVCTFAAIVPEEVSEFELQVENRPPVKVHIEEKVKDELQM